MSLFIRWARYRWPWVFDGERCAESIREALAETPAEWKPHLDAFGFYQ